jgi:glycerol-3-phosphate acyltransferase PlsY
MSILLTQTDIVWPLFLTALIGGYLSGSVPYGLLLTRLAGHGDIRKVGSGNIGATNVLRAGGKKLAAVTLLLDALKGFVPVMVAKQFHMDYAVLAALGAFFGHLFPVWLKFRGGKGVATALGVSYALSPFLGLVITLTWLGMALLFHYSSLAALTAFGLSPFFAFWITSDYQITLTVLIIAVVVFARHHENLARLARGTESKISLGKKS